MEQILKNPLHYISNNLIAKCLPGHQWVLNLDLWASVSFYIWGKILDLDTETRRGRKHSTGCCSSKREAARISTLLARTKDSASFFSPFLIEAISPLFFQSLNAGSRCGCNSLLAALPPASH